jgi:hypothetical protein
MCCLKLIVSGSTNKLDTPIISGLIFFLRLLDYLASSGLSATIIGKAPLIYASTFFFAPNIM